MKPIKDPPYYVDFKRFETEAEAKVYIGREQRKMKISFALMVLTGAAIIFSGWLIGYLA